MTSGAALELRIIEALAWISSNAFASWVTVTPGCVDLKVSIAAAQDWPMALSADS